MALVSNEGIGVILPTLSATFIHKTINKGCVVIKLGIHRCGMLINFVNK